MTPAVRRGVIGWFARALFGVPLAGLFVFVVAGTIRWSWGWAFYLLSVFGVLAHGLVLLWFNPALLARRAKRIDQTGAPAWDKVLVTLAAGVLPYVTWFTGAVDFRFGWSAGMPLGLRVAAVAVWVGSWTWILWATVANRFFAATVHIQPGHRVQSGGPYRYVRHPGYLGAIVCQLLAPIILGSWWALLPALGVAACYTLRAALEDRFLHARLDGYGHYAARVRYRLLPGVW